MKTIKKYWIYLKEKNNKEKFIITRDLIIYIFFLLFTKTPFILVRDIVIDYFNSKSSVNILGNIFFYMFELLYILLFIFMLKKWFTKKFSTENTN